MTEKTNGWLKLLVPVVVYVVTLAVAWGVTQERLAGLRAEMLTKASTAVVDERQAAILRELSDIKIILRDLQNPRRR